MFRDNFITILFLLVAVPLFGQPSKITVYEEPPTADELLKWHEVFTYEVRYSFFKLGEVKVEIISPARRRAPSLKLWSVGDLGVVEDNLYNGKKRYVLKTVITSSGVPFVGDEKNRYRSIFTTSNEGFKALMFWTDNVDEKKFNTKRYIFDYQKDRVYGYVKEKNKRDTLKLVKPATAGHLLFLMSRLKAGTDTTVKVPVYINLKKKHAVITHTVKKVKREVDAFNHPVMTYYTHGNANFDGPFGFSGEFEAWFTVGELRIPVEAHVDVWLGDVKLKLINYKKELR